MRNGAEASTSDDLTRQVASLRALARSLVRDESCAEDLVQDTLVVALERPPRNGGSVRAWLATVARHLALDRARGDRRRVDREQRASRKEGEGPTADPLERLETEREVLDAVRALREPYRSAVFLRYWEGLEPAAIASRLGVPVKTVKSRLSRALEDLRSRLDAKFEGGRSRWMAALFPIAFPVASPPPGSGLGPAEIAGGAWIVKKILVAAAALLLIVIGWRAIGSRESQRAERPRLAHDIAFGTGTATPENPTLSSVVEPAHLDSERETAASKSVAVPSEPRSHLFVKLLHHDGAPAVDVSLDVSCKADPAPREELLRQRTDLEGRVELADLFPGKIEIQVDRGTRFSLDVVAGERREIELRLEEGAKVEGRVVGPRGEPAGGAEVWMEGLPRTTTRAHFVARAAADGSFEIDDVGPYAEIGARAAGFTASYAFEVATLPLGENGSRRVVLELGTSGFEVAGRVLDPAGQPVAGARVKIGERGGGMVDLPNGQRVTQPDPVPVATDSQGRFTSAGGFSEGIHPVTVAARGWPIWRGNVEVRAGSGGRVEIVLAEVASIDGNVVDADGTPIEGAEVVASEEYWGGWYFDAFPQPRAKTDAEGKFRLGWIAPGAQEVNASAPGRSHLGKAKVFAKCVGSQTTTVELVLDPGITISGRVVDLEGQPVAGWRVHAAADHGFGNAYPRQTITDELGRFLLASLDPEHRYKLEANPDGEFSIPSRGELRSVLPGSRDVEIVVENRRVRDATIRGRIAGEDGRAPGDLQLTYYAEGSDSGLYIDFDPKTGAFETEPIFAGRYEVRVYRGGQTVFRTEVFDLAPGETREVGLLSPGELGELELVLTGVSEADLDHARPVLNREGHATEHLTLERGVLRSRTITPGKWKIALHHGGWFLRESHVEVAAGGTTRVELAPERGYEVRVACSFADPEAPWTTLSSKAIDERGEVIQLGNIWFRSAMQDGRVRLHGLLLPAGRFEVEAWTDTGLKGRLAVDAGPRPAEGMQEIVLR